MSRRAPLPARSDPAGALAASLAAIPGAKRAVAGRPCRLLGGCAGASGAVDSHVVMLETLTPTLVQVVALEITLESGVRAPRRAPGRPLLRHAPEPLGADGRARWADAAGAAPRPRLCPLLLGATVVFALAAALACHFSQARPPARRRAALLQGPRRPALPPAGVLLRGTWPHRGLLWKLACALPLSRAPTGVRCEEPRLHLGLLQPGQAPALGAARPEPARGRAGVGGA